MPQLLHGVVGVALGIASVDVPRSVRLRAAWTGAAITLAYWPDVIEWLLKLAGVRVPHSAIASIPCTIASGVLVSAVLFGLARERQLRVHALCQALLASHCVMDALCGGIPLYWPLSESVHGADWLSFDDVRDHRLRLLREFVVGAPLVVAGLVSAALLAKPIVEIAWLAGGLFVLAAVAALFSSTALAFGSVLAAGVVAVCARRVRPTLCWGWSIISALPVLALASAQFFVWETLRSATAAHMAGDFRHAIELYESALRITPLGFDGVSQARIAQCHLHLGEESVAEAIISDGLRRYPGHEDFLVALIDLRLLARDAQKRDPQQALAIARQLLMTPHDDATQAYFERLRAAAEREISGLRGIAPASSQAGAGAP